MTLRCLAINHGTVCFRENPAAGHGSATHHRVPADPGLGAGDASLHGLAVQQPQEHPPHAEPDRLHPGRGALGRRHVVLL